MASVKKNKLVELPKIADFIAAVKNYANNLQLDSDHDIAAFYFCNNLCKYYAQLPQTSDAFAKIDYKEDIEEGLCEELTTIPPDTLQEIAADTLEDISSNYVEKIEYFHYKFNDLITLKNLLTAVLKPSYAIAYNSFFQINPWLLFLPKDIDAQLNSTEPTLFKVANAKDISSLNLFSGLTSRNAPVRRAAEAMEESIEELSTSYASAVEENIKSLSNNIKTRLVVPVGDIAYRASSFIDSIAADMGDQYTVQNLLKMFNKNVNDFNQETSSFKNSKALQSFFKDTFRNQLSSIKGVLLKRTIPDETIVGLVIFTFKEFAVRNTKIQTGVYYSDKNTTFDKSKANFPNITKRNFDLEKKDKNYDIFMEFLAKLIVKQNDEEASDVNTRVKFAEINQELASTLANANKVAVLSKIATKLNGFYTKTAMQYFQNYCAGNFDIDTLNSLINNFKAPDSGPNFIKDINKVSNDIDSADVTLFIDKVTNNKDTLSYLLTNMNNLPEEHKKLVLTKFGDDCAKSEFDKQKNTETVARFFRKVFIAARLDSIIDPEEKEKFTQENTEEKLSKEEQAEFDKQMQEGALEEDAFSEYADEYDDQLLYDAILFIKTSVLETIASHYNTALQKTAVTREKAIKSILNLNEELVSSLNILNQQNFDSISIDDGIRNELFIVDGNNPKNPQLVQIILDALNAANIQIGYLPSDPANAVNEEKNKVSVGLETFMEDLIIRNSATGIPMLKNNYAAAYIYRKIIDEVILVNGSPIIGLENANPIIVKVLREAGKYIETKNGLFPYKAVLITLTLEERRELEELEGEATRSIDEGAHLQAPCLDDLIHALELVKAKMIHYSSFAVVKNKKGAKICLTGDEVNSLYVTYFSVGQEKKFSALCERYDITEQTATDLINHALDKFFPEGELPAGVNPENLQQVVNYNRTFVSKYEHFQTIQDEADTILKKQGGISKVNKNVAGLFVLEGYLTQLKAAKKALTKMHLQNPNFKYVRYGAATKYKQGSLDTTLLTENPYITHYVDNAAFRNTIGKILLSSRIQHNFNPNLTTDTDDFLKGQIVITDIDGMPKAVNTFLDSVSEMGLVYHGKYMARAAGFNKTNANVTNVSKANNLAFYYAVSLFNSQIEFMDYAYQDPTALSAIRAIVEEVVSDREQNDLVALYLGEKTFSESFEKPEDYPRKIIKRALDFFRPRIIDAKKAGFENFSQKLDNIVNEYMVSFNEGREDFIEHLENDAISYIYDENDTTAVKGFAKEEDGSPMKDEDGNMISKYLLPFNTSKMFTVLLSVIGINRWSEIGNSPMALGKEQSYPIIGSSDKVSGIAGAIQGYNSPLLTMPMVESDTVEDNVGQEKEEKPYKDKVIGSNDPFFLHETARLLHSPYFEPMYKANAENYRTFLRQNIGFFEDQVKTARAYFIDANYAALDALLFDAADADKKVTKIINVIKGLREMDAVGKAISSSLNQVAEDKDIAYDAALKGFIAALGMYLYEQYKLGVFKMKTVFDTNTNTLVNRFQAEIELKYGNVGVITDAGSLIDQRQISAIKGNQSAAASGESGDGDDYSTNTAKALDAVILSKLENLYYEKKDNKVFQASCFAGIIDYLLNMSPSSNCSYAFKSEEDFATYYIRQLSRAISTQFKKENRRALNEAFIKFSSKKSEEEILEEIGIIPSYRKIERLGYAESYSTALENAYTKIPVVRSIDAIIGALTDYFTKKKQEYIALYEKDWAARIKGREATAAEKIFIKPYKRGDNISSPAHPVSFAREFQSAIRKGVYSRLGQKGLREYYAKIKEENLVNEEDLEISAKINADELYATRKEEIKSPEDAARLSIRLNILLDNLLINVGNRRTNLYPKVPNAGQATFINGKAYQNLKSKIDSLKESFEKGIKGNDLLDDLADFLERENNENKKNETKKSQYIWPEIYEALRAEVAQARNVSISPILVRLTDTESDSSASVSDEISINQNIIKDAFASLKNLLASLMHFADTVGVNKDNKVGLNDMVLNYGPLNLRHKKEAISRRNIEAAKIRTSLRILGPKNSLDGFKESNLTSLLTQINRYITMINIDAQIAYVEAAIKQKIINQTNPATAAEYRKEYLNYLLEAPDLSNKIKMLDMFVKHIDMCIVNPKFIVGLKVFDKNNSNSNAETILKNICKFRNQLEYYKTNPMSASIKDRVAKFYSIFDQNYKFIIQNVKMNYNIDDSSGKSTFSYFAPVGDLTKKSGEFHTTFFSGSTFPAKLNDTLSEKRVGKGKDPSTSVAIPGGEFFKKEILNRAINNSFLSPDNFSYVISDRKGGYVLSGNANDKDNFFTMYPPYDYLQHSRFLSERFYDPTNDAINETTAAPVEELTEIRKHFSEKNIEEAILNKYNYEDMHASATVSINRFLEPGEVLNKKKPLIEKMFKNISAALLSLSKGSMPLAFAAKVAKDFSIDINDEDKAKKLIRIVKSACSNLGSLCVELNSVASGISGTLNVKFTVQDAGTYIDLGNALLRLLNIFSEPSSVLLQNFLSPSGATPFKDLSDSDFGKNFLITGGIINTVKALEAFGIKIQNLDIVRIPSDIFPLMPTEKNLATPYKIRKDFLGDFQKNLWPVYYGQSNKALQNTFYSLLQRRVHDQVITRNMQSYDYSKEHLQTAIANMRKLLSGGKELFDNLKFTLTKRNKELFVRYTEDTTGIKDENSKKRPVSITLQFYQFVEDLKLVRSNGEIAAILKKIEDFKNDKDDGSSTSQEEKPSKNWFTSSKDDEESGESIYEDDEYLSKPNAGEFEEDETEDKEQKTLTFTIPIAHLRHPNSKNFNSKKLNDDSTLTYSAQFYIDNEIIGIKNTNVAYNMKEILGSKELRSAIDAALGEKAKQGRYFLRQDLEKLINYLTGRLSEMNEKSANAVSMAINGSIPQSNAEGIAVDPNNSIHNNPEFINPANDANALEKIDIYKKTITKIVELCIANRVMNEKVSSAQASDIPFDYFTGITSKATELLSAMLGTNSYYSAISFLKSNGDIPKTNVIKLMLDGLIDEYEYNRTLLKEIQAWHTKAKDKSLRFDSFLLEASKYLGIDARPSSNQPVAFQNFKSFDLAIDQKPLSNLNYKLETVTSRSDDISLEESYVSKFTITTDVNEPGKDEYTGKDSIPVGKDSYLFNLDALEEDTKNNVAFRNKLQIAESKLKNIAVKAKATCLKVLEEAKKNKIIFSKPFVSKGKPDSTITYDLSEENTFTESSFQLFASFIFNKIDSNADRIVSFLKLNSYITDQAKLDAINKASFVLNTVVNMFADKYNAAKLYIYDFDHAGQNKETSRLLDVLLKSILEKAVNTDDIKAAFTRIISGLNIKTKDAVIDDLFDASDDITSEVPEITKEERAYQAAKKNQLVKIMEEYSGLKKFLAAGLSQEISKSNPKYPFENRKIYSKYVQIINEIANAAVIHFQESLTNPDEALATTKEICAYFADYMTMSYFNNRPAKVLLGFKDILNRSKGIDYSYIPMAIFSKESEEMDAISVSNLLTTYDIEDTTIAKSDASKLGLARKDTVMKAEKDVYDKFVKENSEDEVFNRAVKLTVLMNAHTALLKLISASLLISDSVADNDVESVATKVMERFYNQLLTKYGNYRNPPMFSPGDILKYFADVNEFTIVTKHSKAKQFVFSNNIKQSVDSYLLY